FEGLAYGGRHLGFAGAVLHQREPAARQAHNCGFCRRRDPQPDERNAHLPGDATRRDGQRLASKAGLVVAVERRERRAILALSARWKQQAGQQGGSHPSTSVFHGELSGAIRNRVPSELATYTDPPASTGSPRKTCPPRL